MQYYRNYPDIFKIDGKKNSSIYELTSGEIIQLNEKESEILKELEDFSVEEVERKYSDEVIKTVNKAVSNAWGTLYDHPVYAERYLPRMPFEIKGFTEAPIDISEIQIELFIREFFVAQRGEVVFQGCNSVISCANKSVAEYRIERIIENLNEMDEILIRKLSLHVGDFREHFEEVTKVINSVVQNHKGVRLEIVTYSEEITEDILEQLSHYERVELVMNYHHIENPNEVIDCIYRIEDRGISCLVNWIIKDAERENYLKKVDVLKDAGIVVRTTEYIGESQKAISICRNKERLEKTDWAMFFERNRFSICQYGKVSIDAAGDISSCLWQRKLGNIDEGLFKFLEQNKHSLLWNAPKRQFSKCKNCENRYSCNDCAVIEQNVDEGKMEVLCDYNPYEGKWEK